jgi:vacuolar protein sorting-associated protein 53
MDPSATGHAGGSLVSPGASRMILPLGGATFSEGIFGSSGPPTATGTGGENRTENPRREVFSDFRRFVSFGLRKDSTAGS